MSRPLGYFADFKTKSQGREEGRVSFEKCGKPPLPFNCQGTDDLNLDDLATCATREEGGGQEACDVSNPGEN